MYQAATIAFADKALKTFACMRREVANDGQRHAKGGKLLQHLACKPCLKVEKMWRNVVGRDYQPLKTLIIGVTQKVVAIISSVENDIVGRNFGHQDVANGMLNKLKICHVLNPSVAQLRHSVEHDVSTFGRKCGVRQWSAVNSNGKNACCNASSHTHWGVFYHNSLPRLQVSCLL